MENVLDHEINFVLSLSLSLSFSLSLFLSLHSLYPFSPSFTIAFYPTLFWVTCLFFPSTVIPFVSPLLQHYSFFFPRFWLSISLFWFCLRHSDSHSRYFLNVVELRLKKCWNFLLKFFFFRKKNHLKSITFLLFSKQTKKHLSTRIEKNCDL